MALTEAGAAALSAGIAATAAGANAGIQTGMNAQSIEQGNTFNLLNNYVASKQQDYQKALQQQMFAREDTSYQRSVEDATKAGFSPLAVLDGGLNSSGSVVQLSQITPQENFLSKLTAPQFDSSGIQNAVDQYSSQLHNKSENEKNRKQEKENLKTTLQNSNKQLEKQLEVQEQEFEKQHLRNIIELNNQAIKMEEESKYKNKDENLKIMEKIWAIAPNATSTDYEDLDEYKKAIKDWNDGFENVQTLLAITTFDGLDINLGVVKQDSEKRYQSSLRTYLINNPRPLYTGQGSKYQRYPQEQ